MPVRPLIYDEQEWHLRFQREWSPRGSASQPGQQHSLLVVSCMIEPIRLEIPENEPWVGLKLEH